VKRVIQQAGGGDYATYLGVNEPRELTIYWVRKKEGSCQVLARAVSVGSEAKS
jgi:hypothetical protein